MTHFIDLIFSNTIVAFVLLIGIVVFIHELGHFLVGKWVGLRVEEFSIGFGPKAIGGTWKGTEYRINWLPLGGYVRFYGSDLEEDVPGPEKEQSFLYAKPYKRALTSLAGPAANLLLSLVIMVSLHLYGMPGVAPVVSVNPQSVAAQAGLQSGDRIVAINGTSIQSWDQMAKAFSQAPGQPLQVVVDRLGHNQTIALTPQAEDVQDLLGQKKTEGRVGISSVFSWPIVMVKDESLFAALGLRSGDTVRSIQQQPVKFYEEIPHLLQKALLQEQPFAIGVQRPSLTEESGKILELWVSPTSINLAPFIATLKTDQNIDRLMKEGLRPENLTIKEFLPKDTVLPQSRLTAGPVAEAWSQCGLSPGDTLFNAGGYGPLLTPLSVGLWIEQYTKPFVENTAQSFASAQSVWLTVLRQGKEVSLECRIPIVLNKNHLGQPQVSLVLPVVFAKDLFPPEQVRIQAPNIAQAFVLGFEAVKNQSSTILKAIQLLVQGELPLSNLGGPIAIAGIAGDAAKAGLLTFVLTMSFLSVNLGLFNLLPLPGLDGGHLILQALETAYGKPLPLKMQKFVQRFGIAVILTLMVFVFYNDIARLLGLV